MTDSQLNALWREIARTARLGARVIFRTAAEPSLLPGRVDDTLLVAGGTEAAPSHGAHRPRPFGDLRWLPSLCLPEG